MEDGHSNSGSKDYLVSLMFSHYDLNNNGLLEAAELAKVSSARSPKVTSLLPIRKVIHIYIHLADFRR